MYTIYTYKCICIYTYIIIYRYICIYTVSPRPKGTFARLSLSDDRKAKRAFKIPTARLSLGDDRNYRCMQNGPLRVDFALRSSLSDNRAVRTFRPGTHCICKYICIFMYVYI